jgi:hypothetical protein
MVLIETAFLNEGFDVVNLDYPSRSKSIEELAPFAIEGGMERCPSQTGKVHFVTHSLGGILVRYYFAENTSPRLGRVVMLAPPNKGSHVVDKLRHVPGFEVFNGPAGRQLGTGENSVPLRLGPVEFELGIIAGTHTFNPILSLYLPNPDDGKVSVENTKVEGMTDFLEVPHTHTFLMRDPSVIAQSVFFIQHGHFEKSDSN